MELENAINSLVNSIQDVLKEEVPTTKPCPFMKRWWNNELTVLEKLKNKLSKLAYQFRGLPDHPFHDEHKSAAKALKNSIEATKKSHWINWLEEASINDIYMANRYLNDDPTDNSNTWIPDLTVFDSTTNHETLATDNDTKAKVLAETFFGTSPSAISHPA